jgi:hypothetical protein
LSIWKRAISAGLTATLLASLTASATFATVGATGDSDQTDALKCTAAAVATEATCSQVADGISTVTLGGDPTLVTTGNSLYISAAGASMIATAAGSDFTLTGGIVTTGLAPTLTTADTITLRAPAAPGTATVSVYMISTTTGIATLEGTLTITFTATSGLAVSEANSTVKFVASTDLCSGTALASNAADKATNPAAKLCLILKDGNGSAVTTGTTVAVTITPVGLAVAALSDGTDATAGTAQAASTSVNTVAGSYAFGIGGSNLAGTAVIGISVTQGTTTTTFAPKTFTFTGAIASITLATLKSVGPTAFTGATAAISFVAKDATGNVIPTTAASIVTGASYSPTGVFTVTANADSTAATSGKLNTVCTSATVAGTATVKVTIGTVVSNAVTFNCSNIADTYSVAFDKTTVVPGGQATITVTLKDVGGRPAPDTAVGIVVSSGAVLDSNAVVGVSRSGVATWIFLAPFNTGVVTVLASATVDTSASPQSASINVSNPVVVSPASAASALGVTTVGPFTTTTKVAALTKYVTVKMSFGASAAGATVEIWTASKNSAGVWSAFTKKTARIADASGNVYYYVRSSSAAWLSFQGRTASASAPARQARWR